jgi:cytochrome c biogenesis protein CcmG/thiol:disulfide interchange protein DsbE
VHAVPDGGPRAGEGAAAAAVLRPGHGAGVAYQDAPRDSEKFIKEFKVTYPSLRDVGGKLAKDYGTRALPETFVINPQGKVVALSRGTVNQQFLDDAIAKATAS